jgi:hypothetical protein
MASKPFFSRKEKRILAKLVLPRAPAIFAENKKGRPEAVPV